MLARPTEASTSKTLSLGPHIFWTFKAPAVNCCEKYNQAWPFIILWENLDFDICSTGVSGLPKDSGKGCRLHSFNVRLWHPWLLAHVQWHLCAAKQWLWPMYMTNAVPLAPQTYPHRLLKSELVVVIALGACPAVRRQHDQLARLSRVPARWLHWREKISMHCNGKSQACCSGTRCTCPPVASVFEQIVIVHQVCFEPCVKQRFTFTKRSPQKKIRDFWNFFPQITDPPPPPPLTLVEVSSKGSPNNNVILPLKEVGP